MYVIVAYHARRPPAVYGPLDNRYPTTTAEPAHSVVRVPLHPATTRSATTSADPATETGRWPRTVHASRRLAATIALASHLHRSVHEHRCPPSPATSPATTFPATGTQRSAR